MLRMTSTVILANTKIRPDKTLKISWFRWSRRSMSPAVDMPAVLRLLELACLCHQCGTAFGAHPSFPDRAGFGRRELQLPPERLLQSLIDQLQLATAAAAQTSIPLTHVKPHGALYNLAANQPAFADLMITAIRQTVPSAVLIALAGSPLVQRPTVRTAGA